MVGGTAVGVVSPASTPIRKVVEVERLSEPLYEEDIIEGFSMVAFKSYEDLEVGVMHKIIICNKNVLIYDLI